MYLKELVKLAVLSTVQWVEGRARSVATVSGTWKSQSFKRYLKPVADVLADSKYFTYEDFLAFDPTTFQIQLAGTSLSSMKGNQVKVNLYDEYNILVVSKSFAVTLVGGKYTISNPQQFTNWSSNYLDITDKVEVSFEPTNINSDGVTTIVSSIIDNKVIAMSSYYSPKRPDHGLPKDPV